MTTPAAGSEVTAEDVLRRVRELLEAHDPRTTPRLDFLRARFDAGLAWVHGHGRCVPAVTRMKNSWPCGVSQACWTRAAWLFLLALLRRRQSSDRTDWTMYQP